MKKHTLYSTLAIAILAFAPAAVADARHRCRQQTPSPSKSTSSGSCAIPPLRRTCASSWKPSKKPIRPRFLQKGRGTQKEDQDLRARTGKQRSVLSKTAFDENDHGLLQPATRSAEGSQAKKAMLDNAFQHALADIQKVVTDIITDPSKEKGFTIAIPTSQILWHADTKLDISNEVLNRLQPETAEARREIRCTGGST